MPVQHLESLAAQQKTLDRYKYYIYLLALLVKELSTRDATLGLVLSSVQDLV